MKFDAQCLGDYNHKPSKTGKHEFVSVPNAQFVEIEGLQVSFQAENVYINGQEISNDAFQQLINIYAGRQRKAKKLSKRVQEIKNQEPTKCIYKSMDQADRELERGLI